MAGTISALPYDMMPQGFGPITTEQSAAPRKLHHEENINRQVQLCTYLRSMGQPWSEAVFALRALCIGLEDAVFEEEWKGWQCHAEVENDQVVWKPTNTDTAAAFNILMGLLARWGMTFQKRTVSKLPKLPPRSLTPAMQDVIEAIEGAAP